MDSTRLALGNTLPLQRCPHCGIAKPLLSTLNLYHQASESELWDAFLCSNCKGIVLAKGHIATSESGQFYRVLGTFPSAPAVEEEVPEPARNYLEQAHRTLGDAPDAAALIASSSVDAMLKNKGFGDPKKTLNQRIEQAVADRLLTEDMGRWAHHVRFVSNNPRHADEKEPHVSPEQARIVVDFADALGEFLFVLPSRAEKAISDACEPDGEDST